MTRTSRLLACACLLVAVACGEGTTEPPAEPFELGGTYAGMANATVDGAVLDALVILDLQHDGGDLSGTFEIAGTVVAGSTTLEIYGAGDLSGMASVAELPAVSITLRTGFCPEHSGTFAGLFHPATGVLRLGGPIDILGLSCEVVLSFDVLLDLRQ